MLSGLHQKCCLSCYGMVSRKDTSNEEFKTNHKVIVATGVGHRTEQTTIAAEIFSEESRGVTVKAVQEHVSTEYTELLGYLDTSGVTKMQTKGITLTPQLTTTRRRKGRRLRVQQHRECGGARGAI